MPSLFQGCLSSFVEMWHLMFLRVCCYLFMKLPAYAGSVGRTGTWAWRVPLKLCWDPWGPCHKKASPSLPPTSLHGMRKRTSNIKVIAQAQPKTLKIRRNNTYTVRCNPYWSMWMDVEEISISREDAQAHCSRRAGRAMRF